jgi:hypothetical protein
MFNKINRLFGLFSIFCNFKLFLSSKNNTFITGMTDEWSVFNKFKIEFDKEYSSLQEIEVRFDIFRTNLKNIILHNSDPENTFKMGINLFSDLTPDEFRDRFIIGNYNTNNSFIFQNNYPQLDMDYSCSLYTHLEYILPDFLDWRTLNAVTPVKNQGHCGSCWSFSSTGALEGAWAISRNKLYNLSEQQLIDCSKKYGNMGCSGGLMEDAFVYAIHNKGLCTEESYPYTASDDLSCKICNKIATFTKCFNIPENDQIALKYAVSEGPVSIAIEADTKIFQSYSYGVITGSLCGTNLDHGVLIVGYGTENGIDYWLVKNSWGSLWGLDGYVKIQRSNSNDDPGVCGIAISASFPKV